MSTVRIAITGAAGQIGYSLLPRISSGEMFGKNTKIYIQLLEKPPALDALTPFRESSKTIQFFGSTFNCLQHFKKTSGFGFLLLVILASIIVSKR